MQPTEHPTDGLWLTWGANLRGRRNELGLTQFQLAHAAGVAIGRISDMERGVSGGSDATKYDIAKALDCEVTDLFTYPSTKQRAEKAS